MWRPTKADSFLILTKESLNAPSFIAHSGAGFKPNFHIVPCGISRACEFGSDPSRGEPAIAASVGDGAGGPGGPRTGNSSGIWPGNSSGLGGSPGSCTGGGTSGRGFPGGFSCGGSVGCPGLIGGSSCGSIGILLLTDIQSVTVNGAAGAMFPARCFIRARGRPPRYCGRQDRARTRRNNWDDNARGCPARRCRGRPPRLRPHRRHPPWRGLSQR
jgi:hypothetical protein